MQRFIAQGVLQTPSPLEGNNFPIDTSHTWAQIAGIGINGSVESIFAEIVHQPFSQIHSPYSREVYKEGGLLFLELGR